MGTSNTKRFGGRNSVLVLPVLVALVLAAPALATKPPPSVVDAYREMVPTSGGSKALGSGGGRARPLSLHASVALSAGSRGGAVDRRDARLLRRIATSPQLGAPTKGLGAGIAATSGGSGTDEEHLLALIAALALTPLAAVALMVARSRRAGRQAH